jgi:hypothetical protein
MIKMSWEDACYDSIDATQSLCERLFMTYIKHFKYLGSYISYSLQDDLRSNPALQRIIFRVIPMR